MKTLAAVVAIAASAFASSAWGADEPFVLPPAVLEALAPLTAGYQPAKRHVVYLHTSESWNPGNFGRPMYYDGPARLVLQPSGLWFVEASGEFRGKGNAGSAVALSLCGLVAVLNASSSSLRPWQGMGLLGEVSIPDAFQGRERVVEFKATSTDVCRPSTGQAFEIDLTRERNLRLGLLPTSSKRRERLACKVGEAVAASTLGIVLEASALKVACERRWNDDPPVSLEYAFVEPIATYLLVKSVNVTVQGEFRNVLIYPTFEFPASN